MKTSDIKNTIEGRAQIIGYIQYLQLMEEDFFKYIVDNILTRSSIIAMNEVLSKIQVKLNLEVAKEEKTHKEAEDEFNRSRDLVFKHCLMLEVKYNHIKKEILKNA